MLVGCKQWVYTTNFAFKQSDTILLLYMAHLDPRLPGCFSRNETLGRVVDTLSSCTRGALNSETLSEATGRVDFYTGVPSGTAKTAHVRIRRMDNSWRKGSCTVLGGPERDRGPRRLLSPYAVFTNAPDPRCLVLHSAQNPCSVSEL